MEPINCFTNLDKDSYVMKCDYYLMHKDDCILKFNPHRRYLKVLDWALVPISISSKTESFDMILQFCSSRILMMNRPFCKELLLVCGIDDQSPLSICIATRGLSFTDNYWIRRCSHNTKWSDINLFDNEFTPDISKVALTGKVINLNKNWDQIYTGELTIKGTRQKGIFRKGDKILLYKAETVEEINSEICSSLIADALQIKAAKYYVEKKFDLLCSVCEILTETDVELISCRDIMEHNYETSNSLNGNTYKLFESTCNIDFVLMQIFDFLTLNSDRNRDNFGLLKVKNKVIGLYPIFDHDSCFKGVSINGVYFPSGISFKSTLNYLVDIWKNDTCIRNRLSYANYYLKSDEFKHIFLELKTVNYYDGLIDRFNYCLEHFQVKS